MTVYAGVDYAAVLELAQAECDVLVWDGGNNDLPFFRPDLHVVVTDPLRAGDERTYHPGEANLLRADVVVVNKVGSATPAKVREVLRSVAEANPLATVVTAQSVVTLDPGPPLAGARVLVVEDGPTLTHGGMAFGAGTVAARQEGAAELVDPRPFAQGSIAAVFAANPHLGQVLPAMGYSAEMLSDLEATIEAVDADVVVAGTPIDLGRLLATRHPIRRARYELEEVGRPTLADALAPLLRLLSRPATAAANGAR
jgi:predicted GTPase